MATPEFITQLRKKIGHDQLWLPGVGVVIFRDDGRVLLGRRSDTGQWSVISGIPEPGEQPGDAAIRECTEETGLMVTLDGICLVRAEEPMSFPHGDQCVFMDICFVAHVHDDQADQARVNDEESLDMGWFEVTDLPTPVTSTLKTRLEAAIQWRESTCKEAAFHTTIN